VAATVVASTSEGYDIGLAKGAGFRTAWSVGSVRVRFFPLQTKLKDISNNLLPSRTQHRHTHQITDQDYCRLRQSKQNDKKVKRERGVKMRRLQGPEGNCRRGGGRGRRAVNRWKERRREERLSSRGRKGLERRPRMRELMKEGVISRVGLEGKSDAEDTFSNCLKDRGGDFLDLLPKQFQT
jgi:hypothetical protein